MAPPMEEVRPKQVQIAVRIFQALASPDEQAVEEVVVQDGKGAQGACGPEFPQFI